MPKVEKVLIVDDDPTNNFICTKIISIANFAKDVHGCLSAAEALEYLKERMQDANLLPDLIFLDINMPIMNGWKFLDEYQKLLPGFDKKIVLFMLSSSVHKEDIRRARGYEEVADYVSKPLTVDTLKMIDSNYFQEHEV
ncbi:MAG: response regulator [Salibacteraceae bacterium]